MFIDNCGIGVTNLRNREVANLLAHIKRLFNVEILRFYQIMLILIHFHQLFISINPSQYVTASLRLAAFAHVLVYCIMLVYSEFCGSVISCDACLGHLSDVKGQAFIIERRTSFSCTQFIIKQINIHISNGLCLLLLIFYS